MSLNFKTDLKEMRDNNPAGENHLEGDYKASENYDTPGHVRNLCFVWPDGRMKFMNYAYLVSGELIAENAMITLKFTSECIIITGRNLFFLFDKIQFHLIKTITVQDKRYTELFTEESIVTEVVIKVKDN